MNPADPLAQLRDIHLPEPVSWWPPAPGWWIAGFGALAILVSLVYLLRRRLMSRRYRKIALHKLSLIEQQSRENSGAVLEEISAVLRRVAIHTFGRETVAPLGGKTWLEFLDRTGNTSAFSSGAARVLGQDMYRPRVEADIEQVLAVARKWIKEHRRC